MMSPKFSPDVRASTFCHRDGEYMLNLVREPTRTASFAIPACSSKSAVRPTRPCLSNENDCVWEKNLDAKS